MGTTPTSVLDRGGQGARVLKSGAYLSSDSGARHTAWTSLHFFCAKRLRSLRSHHPTTGS
eukprot:4486566-Amphidinium_carterae.1